MSKRDVQDGRYLAVSSHSVLLSPADGAADVTIWAVKCLTRRRELVRSDGHRIRRTFFGGTRLPIFYMHVVPRRGHLGLSLVSIGHGNQRPAVPFERSTETS